MTIHTSTNNRFWNTSGRLKDYGTARNPVPAHDVFVNISPSVMFAETGKRTDTICQLMQDVIDGKLRWQDYINHPFHKTDVALDVIQNKCKPYARVI